MPKVVVRGRTFYYEDSGGSGEPLVFLSGLGGDHRAVQSNAPLLRGEISYLGL